MDIFQRLTDVINFDNIIYAVLVTIVVLLSLSIHEFSHGYVAYLLGDDTPKIYRRLTLNPLKHIDWIGAICLAVFRFGWAKPVPINAYNFKNSRRDIALVSVAGPLSNFLLAFISVLLVYIIGIDNKSVILAYINQFLILMVYTNLGLCVFNLIPIPPLDGSKILASFMNQRTAYKYLEFSKYGSIVLILLLMIPMFGNILSGTLGFIVTWIVGQLESFVQFILGVG